MATRERLSKANPSDLKRNPAKLAGSCIAKWSTRTCLMDSIK